jgi:hypothetical protein
MFLGLFKPRGLHVRRLSLSKSIKVEEEDDILIIVPKPSGSPLALVINKIKSQVLNLKIVSMTRRKSAIFRKSCTPYVIDVYFTRKSTLGQVEREVMVLVSPKKGRAQNNGRK